MTLLDSLHQLHDQLEAQKTTWERLPHQYPPGGDWFGWILEAGRGSGKSFAANMATRDHLNGPACLKGKYPHRAALIAPTIGDAAQTAAGMPGSLVSLQPGAKITVAIGGTYVQWPNGSQDQLFGVHTRNDVERLRAGGNRCWVHIEEFAAWRYLKEGFDQAMLGLRVGPNPRWVMTTTPKPRPEYLEVVEALEGRDDVYTTNASTADNPHLADRARSFLYGQYEDTSLGLQELEGRRIEEAEGALWSYGLIEPGRLDVEQWGRTVVAVDPPGGATECGIVAAAQLKSCRCGKGRLPHYAVLADESAKLSPDGWGRRAVNLYQELGADRVVGEVNYGGDMVESVIRKVSDNVSYDDVRASRGKRVRAEPVKALYEQGRVHHVKVFSELESEMVQWVPDESDWSPNRVDALVWAISYLAGLKPRPDLRGWQVDSDLRK